MAHRIDFAQLDIIVMQVGSPSVPPQVLVTWIIEPIRTGATDVLFHVERSQSPDFSDVDAIEEITLPVPGVAGQTVYEYLDITVNLQSFWRRWRLPSRVSRLLIVQFCPHGCHKPKPPSSAQRSEPCPNLTLKNRK